VVSPNAAHLKRYPASGRRELREGGFHLGELVFCANRVHSSNSSSFWTSYAHTARRCGKCIMYVTSTCCLAVCCAANHGWLMLRNKPTEKPEAGLELGGGRHLKVRTRSSPSTCYLPPAHRRTASSVACYEAKRYQCDT
jgi:hypothetical protein